MHETCHIHSCTVLPSDLDSPVTLGKTWGCIGKVRFFSGKRIIHDIDTYVAVRPIHGSANILYICKPLRSLCVSRVPIWLHNLCNNDLPLYCCSHLQAWAELLQCTSLACVLYKHLACALYNILPVHDTYVYICMVHRQDILACAPYKHLACTMYKSCLCTIHTSIYVWCRGKIYACTSCL